MPSPPSADACSAGSRLTPQIELPRLAHQVLAAAAVRLGLDEAIAIGLAIVLVVGDVGGLSLRWGSRRAPAA
jgi:hypothetical protein